jgi:N-acetylneuraminic acid mutarotase
VFVLTDPRGPWRIAGRLPRPNAYGISCSVAAGVVCIGGGDAREHWREVFLLTWDGREVACRPLPALPTPLAFGSGVTLDGVIYVFGGLTRPDATRAESALFRLDLSAAAPAWETLAPCPGTPRMLAQMGVTKGEIVLCGGVALHAAADGKAVRSYLRDAWAYSPKDGWRQLADMPHAVAAAPSPMPMTARGELLVISGDDGTRAHLIGPSHPGFRQEVFAYDPARGAWRQLADGPLSRATAPTAEWRGGWIIASGERKPGYRSPEIWSIRSDR